MQRLSELTVGQEVYIVPCDSRNGAPHVGTVEKVSKKGTKVNGRTYTPWDYNGFAVGSSGSGYCHLYLNEQEYQLYLQWKKFALYIDRHNLSKDQRKRILEIVNEKETSN